jgi:ATP-dependent Clp protease protease subunit
VDKLLNKIEKDSDRDHWFTAQEAKEYGMIDEILERKPKEEDNTKTE